MPSVACSGAALSVRKRTFHAPLVRCLWQSHVITQGRVGSGTWSALSPYCDVESGNQVVTEWYASGMRVVTEWYAKRQGKNKIPKNRYCTGQKIAVPLQRIL